MKAFLVSIAIVAFLSVPLANATVEVRITNPGFGDTGWIVCADPSCTFVGPIGNYFLASNIAVKDDGFNPFLDMAYSASTRMAKAGTIIIEAMASGYIANVPAFATMGNGNSGLGDTATIDTYLSNADALCPAGINACSPAAVANLISTSGPFADLATGYDKDLHGVGNLATPYSVGVVLTLANPATRGTASGDIGLNAIPEPAGVALFGGVLLFTVSAIRRRIKRVV
jgi:hypothetical protein